MCQIGNHRNNTYLTTVVRTGFDSTWKPQLFFKTLWCHINNVCKQMYSTVLEIRSLYHEEYVCSKISNFYSVTPIFCFQNSLHWIALIYKVNKWDLKIQILNSNGSPFKLPQKKSCSGTATEGLQLPWLLFNKLNNKFACMITGNKDRLSRWLSPMPVSQVTAHLTELMELLRVYLYLKHFYTIVFNENPFYTGGVKQINPINKTHTQNHK